jgi:hypothetical protein
LLRLQPGLECVWSGRKLIAKALANYLDILDLDIARERAQLLEEGETKALTPAQMRKALGL